jgi:hypothetical protein
MHNKYILITALCTAALLSSHAATWSGDGSTGNPYRITSEAQLRELSEQLNAGNACRQQHFILTTDIALSAPWTPAGTVETPFMGYFDGNGHVISQLNIQLPEQNNVGLFGYIKSAVIENLGIRSGAIAGHKNVGAIAGYAIASEIRNCYNHATVTGAEVVGGLVGKVSGGAPPVEQPIYGKATDGAVYWSLPDAGGTRYQYTGDLSYMKGNFSAIYDNTLFAEGSSTYWQPTSNSSTFFPGTAGYVWPMYFTIDMGRRASYNRLKVWMRKRSAALGHLFSANMMTEFEIWGANHLRTTAETGNGSIADNLAYWTSWSLAGGTDAWQNDWVKLADCRLVLPSGITKSDTQTELSEEDQAFISAGFDFYIDPTLHDQAFRYLRFRITATNTDHAQLQICEMRFWGTLPATDEE